MGVNNPHLKSIPEDYKICEPVPDHPLLENVYYPEDIVKGYMWACRFSYYLEPHSPVTILISQQFIGQFASVIKLFHSEEYLVAVEVRASQREQARVQGEQGDENVRVLCKVIIYSHGFQAGP